MKRLITLCVVVILHLFAPISLTLPLVTFVKVLLVLLLQEMAAITSYLSNPQMTSKQYPQHYMENALNYYTTTSM